MYIFKHIFCLFLVAASISVYAQDTAGKPERTPEQEAAKQTENMQRELDLTPEQAARIHEINLKYAKERTQSNQRAEAMERMKNKNEDYKSVLTTAQYEHLQSKRVERRTKPMESTSNKNTPTHTPQGQTQRTTSGQQPNISIRQNSKIGDNNQPNGESRRNENAPREPIATPGTSLRQPAPTFRPNSEERNNVPQHSRR